MKKILIVEDEESSRMVLANKLVTEGFEVIEARNGEEGLQSALMNHPDCILLDNVMPVMDGMTMLRKLRESGEWGKHVSVIILTNLSGDSNKIINDVTNLTPSYYLIKADWTLQDLMTKVKEVCASSPLSA